MTYEELQLKIKTLDPSYLQQIADFIDFINQKKQKTFQQMIMEKRKYFPETQFTPATAKPAYTTRTLSIEDMNAAVDYEAGEHQ
ncbi:hypothetical protein [Thiolinea disciformis]|uniref:hypothetical protein n=1 Tax=Thiolinea disciformis TaxID=125614 RepID=UPI000380ADBC|nr:hypothetical protein [Thiolinea disciformis]